MARPSKFTQAVSDSICEQIAEGRSLRDVCSDETMPGKSTVLRWLADPDHAAFRDQYARAREAQADALVEECLEIADDGSNDWLIREGKEVLNAEHINRSRLRVDTRKWWAARLAPKKYGERVTAEVSGPDGGPIQTKGTIDAGGLTLDQLRALASIKVRA